MTKTFEKMMDVFEGKVNADADALFNESLGDIADFSGYKKLCRHAAHAINMHDEMYELLQDLLNAEGVITTSSNRKSVKKLLAKARGEK